MQRKNENIDRLFENALKDYRVVPEDMVWQQISKRLAEKRKTRALFLVTRIAAGIALVSALGFILYFMIRDRERPAFNNIASNSLNRPAEQQQNVVPVPEYSDSAGTRGITGMPEADAGPVAPSQQSILESMANPEQSDLERTTNLQPSDLERTANARPTGAGKAVFAEKSIDTGLPLSLLARRMAGRLPVLDGTDELQEDQPGKMPEPYTQTGLMQTAESGRIAPVAPGSSWALGGAVAPFYSYRRIASDDLDKSQLTRLNDAENGILAYAGGLNVSYALSGRFSIQSGLYYSRYGQEKEVVAHYHSANLDAVQPEYNLAELDGISITNSTGFIANPQAVMGSNDFLVISSSSSYRLDNLDNISAVQYFDFLEFPLVLSYKLIDRRMDFSLTGGVLTSLLVGNRVYLKQDDAANYFGKTLNIRSVNYVGTVGLEVKYPISGSFTVNIEPRFGYYLRSIDTSSEIRVHPYSFGVYSGVSYRF